MEVCIRNILHTQGLTKESIQTIILADKTASPLHALLQNLIGGVIGTEKNEKLLKKVFKKLKVLIEKRNVLIHSKLFLFNYKTQEDMTEFLVVGEKLHANKKGEAIKEINLKEEEVKTLIQDCRDASIIVSLLTRCIIGQFEVEECFSIKNGQQLSRKYEKLKPVDIFLKK